MNIIIHTIKKCSLLSILLLTLTPFLSNLQAQDCCDQGDNPKTLTMIYTGEGCSATNTTQQSDKYDCDDFNGGPSGSSVYIVASEDSDGGGKIYFSGSVALNGTFTADATKVGDDKFKSKTYFNIYKTQGGPLLQRINMHTSCSAPIAAGDQIGSMFLLSATFKNAVNCGPATPPGPPEECPVPVITINSSQGSNNATVCKAEAITFVTDAPDCSQVKLTWNFGAGANPSTATGKGPHFVTYSSPGTATVTLTADNDCDGGVGTTVCPPPPPPPMGSDCCESISGKPKKITLKYTGQGCSATNTTQESGKFSCNDFSGGPNNDPSVYIKVNEKEDGSGDVYFNGTVGINTVFTAATSSSSLPSNTYVLVYSSQGGTLLQKVKIHTSCSAPLVPGEQFGSMLLESAEWANGSFCDVNSGSSGGGSGGSDCCDQGDKPNSLTLLYNGESCSNTSTIQDSDKYSCADVGGGPNGDNNVYIKVTEKEDGSGDIYFAGDVAINTTFKATSANAGEDDFNSNTWFLVYSSQGGSLKQKIKIHTSCSAPVVAGDQFGSLVLESATFKNGVSCGPVTPPGPNCLDCEETVTIPITIIDCVCVGQGGDSDGDGVCNNQDCAPFDPNFPKPAGTPCNDGNPNTVNDVILADGCSCAGTFSPCVNQGGDSDGDGVCNNQDCAPSDPNFPKPAGTACNDGNPNTVNDVIQADGCSCAGTPVQVCDNVTLGGTIGFGNSCTGSTTVCNNPAPQILNCASPTGGSGDFEIIWLKAINNPNCYPPTTTVDNIDQDPFWSVIPGATGLTYNPGVLTQQTCFLRCTRRAGCTTYIESNIISVNLQPGCGSGPPDCANISITAGNGTITVGNLGAAPFSSLKVFNSSWGTEYACYANCPGSTVTVNVGAGTYYVYAGYVGSNYQQLCEINKTVTVGGGGPCATQGGDSDGDGVCNNQDCQPNNPAFPATPGTPCNDGNPNTTNDVVTANGCGCAGTITTCNLSATFSVPNGCLTDSYLIFADANDPYFPPNNPNYTYSYDIQPANSVANLFTIDPRSVTVTFNSPGVKTVTATITNPAIPNCKLIKQTSFTVSDCSNPCANQGGDSDGDGVCNNQDCQPNNPAFPATPGTPCNDGNPNTTNDVVQANGCSCAGTPSGGTPDCNNISITVNNGVITIGNLGVTPFASVKVFNSGWGTEFACYATCSSPTVTVPVPAGTYYVYAGYVGANYQLICEANKTVTVTGSGPCANQGGDSDGDGVCNNQDCQPNNPAFPATPGTPCNDGNPNTTNDVVTANGCGCAGTVSNPCANQGGDSDGDGVCNNQDCQPNNPAFPATPGTPCNDGNPNTTNDVVTSNGCGCAGTPVVTGCTPTELVRYNMNACHSCSSGSNLDWSELSPSIISNSGCQSVSATGITPVNNADTHSCTPGSSGNGMCIGQGTTIQFSVTLNGSGGNKLTGISFYEKAPTTYYWETAGCGSPVSGPNNRPTKFDLKVYKGGSLVYSKTMTTQTTWNLRTVDLSTDPDFEVNGTATYTFKFTPYNATGSGSVKAWDLDEIKIMGCCSGNTNPCANAGGDSDGDGICNNQDCQPNNAAFPATPGTACNDGNPNTSNDVVTADGCGCAGTTSGGGINCNNITITNGPGKIIVGNLDGAPISSVQVFSTDWTQVLYTCFGNCNATQNIPLPAGSYIVLAKYYNASWQPQCEKMKTVHVTNNLLANEHFDFEVAKQEEHTELFWVHNNGNKVSAYVLERSVEGHDFETIYSEDSKGTESNEVYQAFDLSPVTGDNHYRVRMDMLDGNVLYSEVKTVHFTDLVDFSIFPNPANDFAKVNLESVVGKRDVTISIFNNLGIGIKKFELDEVYSRYYQMDLRDLMEGHYIVWLNIPGHKPLAKQLVIGKM